MSTNPFVTQWLYYIDTCNQRNLDLADRIIEDLMTEDAIFHVPGMPGLGSGLAGQKAGMREWVTANPDFHITVDDVLWDGDKMTLRKVGCNE